MLDQSILYHTRFVGVGSSHTTFWPRIEPAFKSAVDYGPQTARAFP